MFEKSYEQEIREEQAREVECLGMTFPNDDARRTYFLERLREHLRDPEFRKIEGFPIGKDEDILALSDPPYYTACPNPFLAEFIENHSGSYVPIESYSRTPFAADVSEGKNDPIYNIHSYHTKVPHKAIMRYILHYTNPGDIVFDGFCGTGMTGVAAALLAKPDSPFRTTCEQEWGVDNRKGPVWGARRAILCDLAPAATFIAHNLSHPVQAGALVRACGDILDDCERELGWMYEVHGDRANSRGSMVFMIWSDTFFCPECQHDIVFWEAAVDEAVGDVQETFKCDSCKTLLSKSTLQRRMEKVESHHGLLIERIRKVPVRVGYQVNSKRGERPLSKQDLDILRRIDVLPVPVEAPNCKLDPEGEQFKRDALHLRGIGDVSDFYSKRNLIALAALWKRINNTEDAALRRGLQFVHTSIQWLTSLMYRYREGGGGGQQGKLTIPSLIREQNVFRQFRDKLRDIASGLALLGSASREEVVISTGSTTDLRAIPNNSVDYIFTDPPFGGNLYYSDLNAIWEGWLRVSTNSATEAVVHRARLRAPTTLSRYGELMRGAFETAYRILKPGRWITVEFHNSSNAVWNTIQEALTQAKFVVADVRTLDKKQGTFKQVTDKASVKQDLIITAYKPNGGLESRFGIEAGTEEGVWDFVRTHLRQLPVFVSRKDEAELIAERQDYLLFDRMVAFHVQRGVTVPLSAGEFYVGLRQRFSERDGMLFLPEQVAEYDKRRSTVEQVTQLELIPRDEDSAIRWLRQELRAKPSSLQELTPVFMKAIGGWSKFEQPLELRQILEQNFLCYEGNGDVPSQIHGYLSTNYKDARKISKGDALLIGRAKGRWYVPDPNKAGDLVKLREKSLLKEFDDYKGSKARTLKVFRIEAMRAGFKRAYDQRDYQTIIDVAARIPETVLQEDEKLLMYYDVACMRLGTKDESKLF